MRRPRAPVPFDSIRLGLSTLHVLALCAGPLPEIARSKCTREIPLHLHCSLFVDEKLFARLSGRVLVNSSCGSSRQGPPPNQTDTCAPLALLESPLSQRGARDLSSLSLLTPPGRAGWDCATLTTSLIHHLSAQLCAFELLLMLLWKWRQGRALVRLESWRSTCPSRPLTTERLHERCGNLCTVAKAAKVSICRQSRS